MSTEERGERMGDSQKEALLQGLPSIDRSSVRVQPANEHQEEPQARPDVTSLPEVQKVAEYLRDMKFKQKAVGGVDLDDVLGHLDTITRMYNAAIGSVLTGRSSQLDAERAALHSNYMAKQRELEESFRARCVNQEAEAASYRERLENEYKSKADHVLGSLSRMDEVCDGIMAQAQEKADALVSQAQAQASSIEEEARQRAAQTLDTARADAYKERQRAEELANRRLSELADHEERIRQLRQSAGTLCADMQEAIDRVRDIAIVDPGACGMASHDGYISARSAYERRQGAPAHGIGSGDQIGVDGSL